MVRYEMAIYEYKEFLTLDDVAEYLTDKGVSNFYPRSTYTEKRLNELLSDWIKSEKLQPLYPFRHNIMQYKLDYEHNIDESNVYEFAENILNDFKRIQKGEKIQSKNKAKRIDIGEKFIDDYLIFGSTTWEELWIFDKTILGLLDWCKFYNDENNKYPWNIVYCDDIPQEYRKFTISRNRVVFLKSQLDAIFNSNQPNLTDLEQENDRLQARIAELENQLATQNSTPVNVEKPIHTNTALTALFDVMNTHWQNPNQPPKQAFIQKWIVEKYPSIDPSKALWIDKIIRHQDQK